MLLAAVPVQWKQIIYDRCDHVNINQDVIEKSYISISNIDLCKKATKYVYEYLILKYSQEPISIYNKWNVELDINYDSYKWANIFERLNKTTKSTKLKYFMYRVFYRILPTNIYLKKYKIKTDMIILFFKYYIYRCKCERILPNIESFIKQFLYVKETEKIIAVGKCKERIFKDKWKELVDV